MNESIENSNILVGISYITFIITTCLIDIFNLPLSIILSMVLQLNHSAVFHKILSVIRLFVVVELSELLSNLLFNSNIRLVTMFEK